MKRENGKVILDHAPAFSPVCSFCRHAKAYPQRTCDAFPAGIPTEIWSGQVKHTAPHRGDRGIRFEAVDGASEEVLARYDLPETATAG